MLITLNATQRIWAVPAVLGQVDALRDLHARLREELNSGDCLIYLGNYMGYGPKVAGTLDELLRFSSEVNNIQVVHLRGAQEEMWVKLLEIQWAMRPNETFQWMMKHGAEATLRAYGGDPSHAQAKFFAGVVVTTRWTTELRGNFQNHAGHYEFLHSLASAAPTSNGSLLFVSGGIDPSLPLEKQNDSFWWNAKGFESMEMPFGDFIFVIRGFDAGHNGLHFGDHAITIDASTSIAGPLKATCFEPNGKVVASI